VKRTLAAIIVVTFVVSSIASVSLANAVVSQCNQSPLPSPKAVWVAICDIQSQITALNNLLNAETTARQTGDTSLQTQINNIPAGPAIEVIRFSSGRDTGVHTNPLFFFDGETITNNGIITEFRIASAIVGIDGTITKFHYDVGQSNSVGNTIRATLYKNGVATNFTCDVLSGTPTSCEHDGSLSVNAGDLIAVQDQVIVVGSVSFDVDSRKAFVLIEKSS